MNKYDTLLVHSVICVNQLSLSYVRCTNSCHWRNKLFILKLHCMYPESYSTSCLAHGILFSPPDMLARMDICSASLFSYFLIFENVSGPTLILLDKYSHNPLDQSSPNFKDW